MRRVADFLFRNWPLRLGAILLATVLYTGLVLGQNVRTWTGTVPVDAIRLPAGVALLNQVEPVTTIRYRAPLDIGVLSPDSFRATVDLSDVPAEPGGPPRAVTITLIALSQRVQIVDFQPREVQVQLDPVTEREVPVTVSLGSVAEGLNVGPPQTEPSSVTLRGASSRVDNVSQVVARVSIDASALNIDREIELIAVDGNGNQVPNVEIDPERARVRIAVARELANRTLPVVPQLTGTPAFGYRISRVTVEPLVVTVSGEAATVIGLEVAPTLPIDVEGRTTDLEASIGLALPPGVSVSGSDQVRVMITIEQELGSETFPVAIQLVGAQPGLIYVLGTSLPDGLRADVVLGGPLLLLDGVNAAALLATADLSGLGAGTHDVILVLTPPEGLEVVDIVPQTLTIEVQPAPSPSPSP